MNVSLVVHVSRDARGALRGVVERVRTGRKERFVGMEMLRDLIERMVDDAATERAPSGRKRRWIG